MIVKLKEEFIKSEQEYAIKSAKDKHKGSTQGVDSDELEQLQSQVTL